MSDKKDSYSARRVPCNTIQWPEDEWKDGREWHLEFGYTPDLPCPFLSFRLEHAPNTTLWGILLLMAGFTFSTPESSSSLSVLVCGHVCRGMEPNEELGMAGKPIKNELDPPSLKRG